MAQDAVGDYCDYLDKEMTIMGLLTAFAVGVPAVVLDRTAGADMKEQPLLAMMWHDEIEILGAGTVAFFLSALAFYLQRSHLAYFYGQLRLSRTKARYSNLPTATLLRDADSWSTWTRYTTAFVLLTVGVLFYAVALFAPKLATNDPAAVIAWLTLPAVGFIGLNWGVKTKYQFEDHPWRKFFGR